MFYLYLQQFTPFSKDYRINSPDGRIRVSVEAEDGIKWTVSYDGKDVFSSSKIEMVLADGKSPWSNRKSRESIC